MKKTVNLLTLSVFMVSNILTPLTNFIYATETETVEEVDDVAVVRDVVGEETPDNSLDETPELSPEETDNDSIGEAGTPDEEEEYSGEINYPEVQPEAQAGEGSQEGEQVDGTSSESSESHNSAVTPSDNTEGEEGETVTEAESQDSQTEERNVMEDEDRDITGVCQGNQDYNEDLDICYTLQAMSNVPVYYGTDMDSTHKYNGNPIGTITIKLDDGRTITMMDKNLGASTAGTSSSSNGELYQRGNNAGVRSATVNTNSTKYKLYAPGNWFYSPILRGKTYSSSYSSIIWDDTFAHDNLWGGEGDRSDRSLIKGGKMRQGPCPDGYHIPSAGEWSAVLTYWYNTKNSANMSYSSLFTNSNGINTSEFSNAFKLPLAGYRVPGGSTYSNYGYYWTSTPGMINYNSDNSAINLYMGSSATYMSASYRSRANSLRCFKDSSDDIVHTVTFDTNGGYWKVEDKDSIDLYVLDGKTVTMPPYPTHETSGLYFAGWTEDPDSTDYFDWNTPITEDITLYAKYEGEPQSGEKYIEELGANATRDTTNTVYYRQDNGIGAISIKVPGVDTFITMMDRNLGATSNNINNTDSYGDYYQWGNNYGFTSGTINKTTTQVPYRNYRPGNPYIGNQFVYYSTCSWICGIANYWENDSFYDVLRGGKGDKSTDSVDTYYGGIKNGKTRQGPCPDGYHVPSMGEWNLIYKYWNNLNSFPAKQYTETVSSAPANDFATIFKLPLAGQYWTGGTLGGQGSNGYYHTSSYGGVGGYGSKSSQYYHFNIRTSTVDMQLGLADSAANGFSVRCFKDSPDAIVHTVTFHDESGYFFGENNTEVRQFVKDGTILQTPTNSYGNYGNGLKFLGWTEDLNSKNYFNFSNSIEEDMDLYGKWGCKYDGKEYDNYIYDGTKCTWKSSGTTLLQGSEFNMALKTLAKGEPVTGAYVGDNLIKGFEWRDSLPVGIDMTKVIDISSEGSEYPVYAWFDTAGYENGEGIIYYTSEANKIYMNPNSEYMFEYMQGLTSLNLSNLDTSKIINMSYIFQGCSSLETLNLDNWDLSNLGNNNYSMYYNTNNLTSMSLKNWILPDSASNLVGGCGSGQLEWIDVSGWDLSQTTSVRGLFSSNKTKEIRGLNTWDTSNLTNMSSMFDGCRNLTELDLSNFDTSNVTDMYSMFSDCNSLTEIDVSNFDTSNVTNMNYMFYGCSNLTEIDVSNFDTSNVTNMNSMFYGCSNLTELDLSNFDTSNVTDMSSMFSNCNNLTELDLSKFDTSNVTNMDYMFYGCSNLTELDLSNFDTSNVTSMYYMFYFNNYYGDSSNLSTIYASDKFKTNPASGTGSYNSMFQGNKLLVGGQGTTYNSNYTNNTYARIDGGPTSSTPGYFTAASNITYHLDGGELRNAKHAYSPLFAFKLAIPVKEGYTFIGWTGSNGNTPAREVTVPKGTEGDLEYTANWAANKYQIIFDVDGGNDIDPIEVEYNSSLEGIQLPTPTKGGYKFVGWDKELPETMPAEDITIVASWEQVSQGSYSSGGGSKTSTIDVVKATVDDNTHKAADKKDESKTPDGKEGSNDSSDAASVEANNSQEFVEAYNFAKTNGITTQSSIQKAKMNSPLTRIAMAKMLSYYAINVLGQEPDMSKTINFDDVSAKRDAEYDNGVTLAYQLGIMGINMKNNRFRPNDEVTRAEFVTALSRMIYGMKDGIGKMKYYEPHMARMYNEGIINETNPKMKEKRGYVMIMLMRTVQK